MEVACSDLGLEPGSEHVHPKLVLGTSCRIVLVFASEKQLKQGLQCLSMGSEV